WSTNFNFLSSCGICLLIINSLPVLAQNITLPPSDTLPPPPPISEIKSGDNPYTIPDITVNTADRRNSSGKKKEYTFEAPENHQNNQPDLPPSPRNNLPSTPLPRPTINNTNPVINETSPTFKVEAFGNSDLTLSQVRRLAPRAFRRGKIIQVGIFSSKENAEEMARKLAVRGLWSRIRPVNP
ncbi:MAG: SPOR domain-containing protein, partial [Cyanobacteria bacterium J083]